MVESSYTAPPRVAGLQRFAMLVGLAGIALCAVGFAANREHFFKSYLLAYVFWIGIALGSLALSMVHHLSGGAWGVVIRRVLEAASRTLPFMALLFLPIAFGMHELYLWANADAVARDAILQHKAPYLNVPFFFLRAAIYFAVWSALAFMLSKWSLEQEREGEHGQALKMQRLSGGGLVLYAITILFMSVDWVMSLDPHWFSTIYGVLFMGGQGLTALAFLVIALAWLSRREPLNTIVVPSHFHDLGNLMLAFVMLWAYFSFSQYLIIYSGNLPEEITWYTRRLFTGWRLIGIALVLFHFAVSFLILLSRSLKRNPQLLVKVAVGVIVVRLIDLFWLIAAELHRDGFAVSWLDVRLPLSLGSVWLGCFIWQLRGRPLLPLHDPQFHEALGPMIEKTQERPI